MTDERHWEFDGKPVTYPQLILAHAAQRHGLSGFARCVPDWPIGYTESRLNDIASGLVKGSREHTSVMRVRDLARRIRKPLNSDDDFFREAAWALIT